MQELLETYLLSPEETASLLSRIVSLGVHASITVDLEKVFA
mgnify:FL=1